MKINVSFENFKKNHKKKKRKILFVEKKCLKYKKVKIAKFGTFSLRKKNQRIGRNPKTKETVVISERNVVLFKPSKEFKEYINKNG